MLSIHDRWPVDNYIYAHWNLIKRYNCLSWMAILDSIWVKWTYFDAYIHALPTHKWWVTSNFISTDVQVSQCGNRVSLVYICHPIKQHELGIKVLEHCNYNACISYIELTLLLCDLSFVSDIPIKCTVVSSRAFFITARCAKVLAFGTSPVVTLVKPKSRKVRMDERLWSKRRLDYLL